MNNQIKGDVLNRSQPMPLTSSNRVCDEKLAYKHKDKQGLFGIERGAAGG